MTFVIILGLTALLADVATLSITIYVLKDASKDLDALHQLGIRNGRLAAAIGELRIAGIRLAMALLLAFATGLLVYVSWLVPPPPQIRPLTGASLALIVLAQAGLFVAAWSQKLTRRAILRGTRPGADDGNSR